jgi:hypothetical protein
VEYQTQSQAQALKETNMDLAAMAMAGALAEQASLAAELLAVELETLTQEEAEQLLGLVEPQVNQP